MAQFVCTFVVPPIELLITPLFIGAPSPLVSADRPISTRPVLYMLSKSHALHQTAGSSWCTEGGSGRCVRYRKTRFQTTIGARQLGHSLSRSLGRHAVHMSTCPHGQVTISRGWS